MWPKGVAPACLMGVVFQGWGLGMHAFGMNGGQASHCNFGVVVVMSAIWPEVCVCVFETHLWGAVSVG